MPSFLHRNTFVTTLFVWSQIFCSSSIKISTFLVAWHQIPWWDILTDLLSKADLTGITTWYDQIFLQPSIIQWRIKRYAICWPRAYVCYCHNLWQRMSSLTSLPRPWVRMLTSVFNLVRSSFVSRTWGLHESEWYQLYSTVCIPIGYSYTRENTTHIHSSTTHYYQANNLRE